ncbi:MAG: DUF1669 domain-containing protein [Candidatus Gastranaerophilales bacterium]|nr:DUF1669 domain-containing protein [Candidatus Gastranaerophilales bacterium]
MKNKIISLIIFCLIFLVFCVVTFYPSKPDEYKVLDIVRADLFYLDINNNNKIDKGELFKLKGAYTLSPILNDFSIKNSKKLNLDKVDYLKVGFLVQQWAWDNLKGKKVIITSMLEDKSKPYKYITVDYKGSDLSKFYLENGMAFTLGEDNGYIIYQNDRQIKENAKELSKLDFVLLNLNSNIYHKLNCEFIDLMRNAKLILFKNTKDYIPCKSCFNKTFEKESISIPKVKNIKFNRNFNKFELYFTNPLNYQKPDGSCSELACKKLVSEINNAKNTIDIALYGIGDVPKVYNALNEAKLRGVKIRAVVDYSRRMDELYPKTGDFIKDFNSKTDNSEIIMHNKFFIFDDKKIMTGSANISPSGIGGYSANSLVFLESEKIAQRFKSEFEQMYQSKFSALKDKFDIVCDSEICAYFSPKDDIKNVILSKINSSKEEICVSAFYLTHKDIINALISAKARGVKVYIIQDAVGANNFKNRLDLLRKAGILLKVENWGGKDHEKTIVFDNKSLLIGSANFSASALSKNDENVLLIENEQSAKFYREYFFYLFNSIDNKYLYRIPRAEGIESINSCTDGIDNNFDGKIDKEDAGCN